MNLKFRKTKRVQKMFVSLLVYIFRLNIFIKMGSKPHLGNIYASYLFEFYTLTQTRRFAVILVKRQKMYFLEFIHVI